MSGCVSTYCSPKEKKNLTKIQLLPLCLGKPLAPPLLTMKSIKYVPSTSWDQFISFGIFHLNLIFLIHRHMVQNSLRSCACVLEKGIPILSSKYLCVWLSLFFFLKGPNITNFHIYHNFSYLRLKFCCILQSGHNVSQLSRVVFESYLPFYPSVPVLFT